MFRFLMLEGVWIIVGTAKIFAEQNGDRGVEILDSAPFDASHGLLPCYNRSGAAVFPLGLTASGKYLTAPDRFPRADWQHKFLVTGLNPLSIIAINILQENGSESKQINAKNIPRNMHMFCIVLAFFVTRYKSILSIIFMITLLSRWLFYDTFISNGYPDVPWNISPNFKIHTENVTKVTEYVTKITEDVTKVTEDVTKVTEDVTKITEDVTKVTEDVTKVTEGSRKSCDTYMCRAL